MIARVKNKIDEVDSATARTAPLLPSEALRADFASIKALQRQAEQIHQCAITAAINNQPPMLLLWDFDDYHAHPVDARVQDHFTLREYLQAEPKEGADMNKPLSCLRYLSLNGLPQAPAAPGDQERTPAPRTFSVQEPSMNALSTLLANYGQLLEIDEQWFDEPSGLFRPELFFAALKAQKIRIQSLENESTREAWCQAISQVLFSKPLSAYPFPFDSAYPAQYLRFVASLKGQAPSIKFSASQSSPELAANPEALAPTSPTPQPTPEAAQKLITLSQEAKAELNLSAGEINLVRAMTGEDFIRLPEQIDAEKIIPICYTTPDGTAQRVDFQCGDFQLRFYGKAYGFVAAQALLKGETSLMDNGQLSHPEIYQREGDTYKTELIKLTADAKIGVEMGCSIDWHPPQSAIPKFALDGPLQPMPLLKGAVIAELSKELTLPFRFRKVNRSLRLDISIGPPKGKISFSGEVYPEAIGAWIWQFQRLLRQCGYRRIDIADEETFQALSTWSRAMLYSQLQLGLFLAKERDLFDRIIDVFSRVNAGRVAHTLVFAEEEQIKPWVQYLVPEALGPLLATLVVEPEEFVIQVFNELTKQYENTKYETNQAEALQYIALSKIFTWLGQMGGLQVSALSKRQVQKALERMNSFGGASASKAQRLRYFYIKWHKMDQFLSRSVNLKDGNPIINNQIINNSKGFEAPQGRAWFKELTHEQLQHIEKNKDQIRSEAQGSGGLFQIEFPDFSF